MADILIYGDIGGPWEDSVLAKDVAGQLDAVPDSVTSLNVRINSLGGLSSEGLAIYNLLRAYATKRRLANSSFTLSTVVDGYAYSAASIIVMAGDRRIMHRGSMLMVHNAWLFTIGNAQELRDAANYLDKVDLNLADIYAHHSGQDRQAILDLMKAETFFSPEEAKAARLIDTVDDSVDTAQNKAKYGEAAALLARSGQGSYERFMAARYNSATSKASSKGCVFPAIRLRLMEMETAA